MNVTQSEAPAFLEAVERTASELTVTTNGDEPPVGFVYGMSEEEVGLERLGECADVSADTTPASERPYFGPLIQLLQKVVKRASAWYIDPFAGRISEFNRTAAHVLRRLMVRMDRLEAKHARRSDTLRRDVDDLRERVARLEQAERAQGAARAAGETRGI